MAESGLEHFELSMQALHTLTQCFTAEFSIRPFLQQHPQATLERLMQWTQDPSELKTLDLTAHATQRVGKQLSLAEMTTRKHYPGVHRVDAILNGRAQFLGRCPRLVWDCAVGA